MKLTVGPLPPAVYWRRRAAVAGTLLLAMFALLYSCTGTANVSRRTGAQSPAGRDSSSPTPTPSASVSPSAPVFTSGGGIDIPAGDGDSQSASASPSLVPAAQPSPAPSGPCTDGEIAVTAAAASTSVAQGSTVRFYLRVKNIAGRSCTRDVGADAQELYLQNAAKAKVWSSDSCDAQHGTDVRMFGPNIEAEFYLDWHGNATDNGCPGGKVAPGKYELVARLATKLSDPVVVEVK
ncbi:hypothetical protein HC031_29790 [Planosporangium thailandense]|uniref:DUF4232 domain-containing protein n=1 Tax=Planosporangium thailandense TaxID=765197 RepID=A0ABX0Y661_9ACTN|nr:hypothetical protein [Planosporangium thailandense]NJC73874.1 hypothetical protein [Planosporangium thailandense]